MNARLSWLLLVAAVLLAFVANPLRSRANEVDRQLRDAYKGKVLVLREFSPGKRLKYDASGMLLGGRGTGDWMSDGFVEIRNIHSSHHQLVVEAERLLVIQFQNKEFDFLRERISEDDKHPVEIDVDLDSRNDSPQQAEAVLAKILLTAHDSLESIVPNYWKPCVRDAAASALDFSFSAQLLVVPGVAVADTASAADLAGGEALTCKVTQHPSGGRTSPPRMLFAPTPEFSDRARREKKQGTATVGLVVNEKGLPENVRVITPLGYGLDQQAINCAQKWRFQPAERDGEPVGVWIAIQMDFHLY